MHVGHTVWLESNRAWNLWVERICPHTFGAWGKLSHRQTSVAISILLDQLSVTGDTGRMSCNSGMACAITKQHGKNILIEFINCYREHPALWKVKFRQSLGSNLKSAIKFECEFICRFKIQFLVHIDLLVTFFLMLKLTQ